MPNRHTRLLTLFALLIAAPLLVSPAAADDRAASILERHREASGAERLDTIETLSMRGVAEAGVMRFELHERRKRPGRLRLELSLDGKTIVQATDGQDAWWLDPVMGSGKVESMPAAYRASFHKNADFDDFYLAPGDAGFEAAWVGEHRDDDGRVLDELTITYDDGASHARFFDRETGLYVRQRSSVGGQEVVADFEDFRPVGGVLVPFVQALSLGQRFVYEDAKVNEPIDDALFARP